MSQTSPPQTITPGAPTSVKPPSSTPWGAVVIQNLSPYLVEVQAAAQVAWVAPFSADVFAPGTTNAPVVLTAVPVAGGLSSTLGGAQVQATWYDPDEAAALQAAYPVNLPGSAVLSAQAPPGVVFGPTSLPVVGNAVTQDVQIPSVTRSIVVDVTTNAPSGLLLGIKVQGDQSGFVYRQGPYYLQSSSTLGYIAVVPVSGVVDTSVTVSLTSVPAGTATLAVYADNVPTQESVFYNGELQEFTGVAVNTTTVLLTGPARLLTAFVEGGSGTAGSAQFEINNQTIARVDIAASGAAQSMPITFPENTILPAGQTLKLVGTLLTGVAGGSYAYP